MTSAVPGTDPGTTVTRGLTEACSVVGGTEGCLRVGGEQGKRGHAGVGSSGVGKGP